MKGGLLAIEPVQLLHPVLHTPVHRVLQHMPFQAGIVRPLTHLPELASHEQQLLAWLRVHVSQKQAQIGELLPFIARHLADE